MADIRIEAEPERLTAFVGDVRVGWMDFEVDGSTVRLYHTEVPAAQRGTGTGTRLVLACLAWFRDNTEYRIVPLCPFIPAVMRRFPEYNDLLKR
ncbi:MAG: GNAT family N-acetyltransferase [Microbacteriaceae bacterium]